MHLYNLQNLQLNYNNPLCQPGNFYPQVFVPFSPGIFGLGLSLFCVLVDLVPKQLKMRLEI